MLKPKKIPLRKCVVTNEQHPKSEMFRVVRDPDGNVLVDKTGKAKGRGAYVSKNKTAILGAKKKKALDRHLEVAVPDTIYDELIGLIDSAKQTKSSE
ncbi:MAG TPA: YlxR family protein [Bacilli bacterium]|nr:YlxR family protein [Bacilli bacterium]